LLKSKELLSSHSLSLIEAHKVEHYYETKNLYDEYIRTKKNFEETTLLMQSVNNYELLTKAYSLGEMSSINYILELTFYYSMKDKMDILERNYHLAYAKLFKQKLN
jgi:cobalt-zinc-cadmium efflux system outer membrane protein